jgi:hypothetical protein
MDVVNRINFFLMSIEGFISGVEQIFSDVEQKGSVGEEREERAKARLNPKRK